ncbi:hypothetical protein OIY81_820 [Cryptosporidium canis]|uniref:Symplekin C-terminal domain-containing protein n=1 Tax=Cryptosporidium canis TaxID=195482 RepID=A0ABQ8P8S5_9CRYT|nr:hypothetical protein OJ252_1543 [Cryptosporidium canis]KAJ1613930.1 hypothetical protein OIY81_820 [Cryptosporidium canis]
MEEDDRKLLSHFLQLSVQRKVRGFRLKHDLNISTAEEVKTANTRTFSSKESCNLPSDYIKAVNIIKELMNDRFDQDYNVRVKLVRNLEKILKVDSIFTCIIVVKLSELISDNNINVIKAIVDVLYNQIEGIISNLLLPYSIKQLLLEKEDSMIKLEESPNAEESRDENSVGDSWWDSEVCKELNLASSQSLNSLNSIVQLISKVIETYGNGGKISSKQDGKELFISNSFQVDDEWKKEQLYKKTLKLAFKILRICMINTNILQEVKPNLILETKSRVNHQYWDYPGNLDISQKNVSRVLVMQNTQLNGNYVYLNQFGCILPIEIVLCKSSVSVFEDIIKNISGSIEYSGRLFFRLRGNYYLNICYWIQFIGWLCSAKGIYLNKFISSIIEFSNELFNQDKEKDVEKMNAVKFVFQEELLRILASASTYDNVILIGEIVNILNKLGKKGNLYEIRQEAINKFSSKNAINNINDNHNNNLHVDDKNDSEGDAFPPIHAQKLRGMSTRYSYKKIRYDVDDGFYSISPQSVIEGVSWLFSTNSYSNVVDIAVNNFLNLKIPNNLFTSEDGGTDNRQKKNLELILNSSKFPWTNEFSPLDSNRGLNFDVKDEKRGLDGDCEREMKMLDDNLLALNYESRDIKQILASDSSISSNVDNEIVCSKKRTLSTFDLGDYSSNEDLEGLTNAINMGTWEELKNNSNSMKSILFSQIITSVLVSPAVDISADGLYKVSKTLLNNNQLMNIIKHGQLILTSWELLLKRINESENKDIIASDIERYGEGVNIAWSLLVERMVSAFDILFYKYKLLIRLVLSKKRSLLENKSDLKMEQVFIEILVSTLLSETKELLTNILLITNISDDEYSYEINEDYFVYLDDILYHDTLGLHNIQCMNDSSINNSDSSNASNSLRNINLILMLWIYNFVLEQRIQVIHNLFFRFYYLDSGVNDKGLIFEEVFQWIINEKDMENDIMNEEDDSQTFFDYNKLFIFCFNNFTKCISNFNAMSNVFLSQLKNLIINTPKVPNNFLRLLFNNWIYSNNSFCMHLSTINQEVIAQTGSDTSALVKREYALNLFYELLDSNYPVNDIRKISYFIFTIAFLSYNLKASRHNFLDRVCLLLQGGNTVHIEMSDSDTDKNMKSLSHGNFFDFTRQMFSVDNIKNGKKINIQPPNTDNNRLGQFIDNLIFVLYGDTNEAESNSPNSSFNNLKGYLSEDLGNWSDIEIYGEMWMIILSFILVSGVIPDEMYGNYDGKDVTSLFGTNKFVLVLANNLMEMINHSLHYKYRNKFDMSHIFNHFTENVVNNSGNENSNEASDEFSKSQINEKVQNMVIDQNQTTGITTESMNLNNVTPNDETYLNYTEDLFSNLCLLFKYYCLRYPSLIHCLFILYLRIMNIAIKYQQDGEDNVRVLKLINKIKGLYVSMFKEMILLFKKHYTSENGNLDILIKEYLRILNIYSSDYTKYSHLFDLVTYILQNINFSNIELCTKVYDMFKSTQSINLIIPMIGYYDLQKIKELLPLIINKSDRLMIKECIKNIVTNPFAIRDSVISPSDLLLQLISYSYPDVNYVDKKKTVDIIDCCFELTQTSPAIFDSEIIASVIGKIVQDEKSVFPRTLGRTLVLSVIYLPTVRSFISSFVISSLIRNNKVWEDTLTWRGVKHCIQKLWCDYKTSIFPSLILLPSAEFQGIFNELIETNSDLRADCMDIIKKTVSLFRITRIFEYIYYIVLF